MWSIAWQLGTMVEDFKQKTLKFLVAFFIIYPLLQNKVEFDATHNKNCTPFINTSVNSEDCYIIQQAVDFPALFTVLNIASAVLGFFALFYGCFVRNTVYARLAADTKNLGDPWAKYVQPWIDCVCRRKKKVESNTQHRSPDIREDTDNITRNGDASGSMTHAPTTVAPRQDFSPRPKSRSVSLYSSYHPHHLSNVRATDASSAGNPHHDIILINFQDIHTKLQDIHNRLSQMEKDGPFPDNESFTCLCYPCGGRKCAAFRDCYVQMLLGIYIFFSGRVYVNIFISTLVVLAFYLCIIFKTAALASADIYIIKLFDPIKDDNQFARKQFIYAFGLILLAQVARICKYFPYKENGLSEEDKQMDGYFIRIGTFLERVFIRWESDVLTIALLSNAVDMGQTMSVAV
jgi:hypothetical protein